MSSEFRIARRRRRAEDENRWPMLPSHLDDVFDDFRRDIESSSMYPWPSDWVWGFPPSLRRMGRELRVPPYDMVDKGDKYDVQLEIPEIDKNQSDVKATKNSVEISGEQSEKTEEKTKHYLVNEMSYRSFHRRIPFLEEIVLSKIDAKMNNDILRIELPKKVPIQPQKQITKVEVK